MAIYNVPTANFIQKTLNAELLSGVTAAATLNNVTSIQNLLGVMIVDRVDANGTETPSKVEVIIYAGTSGSTVVTLTRGQAGTTEQDHAVGAIVEFGPDVLWAQGIIDALGNLVDTTTGAVDTTKVVTPGGTQTLTNKTISGATLTNVNLSSPQINYGSDAVGDIFIRGAGGSTTRLPIGTTGQALLANASLPYWSALPGVESRSWVDFADDTNIYIDFSLGKKFKGTVVPSGARTFYSTNASVGDVALLRIGYASTASIAINIFTVNSTVKWPESTIPTLTKTASKADLFGFVCTATLPVFDGATVGQNYSL